MGLCGVAVEGPGIANVHVLKDQKRKEPREGGADPGFEPYLVVRIIAN